MLGALPWNKGKGHARRKISYTKLALTIFLLLLLAVLIAIRIYLPVWAKDYVNRTINSIPGYEGGIADIDIHLYRGAYTIHKLEIRKKTKGMPVPFVKMDSMDLSVEWRALFNGRIVSEIDAYKPEINFAVNKSGTDMQTGQNVDWTEKIRDLVPIDINKATIHNGTIFYRNFSTSPEINISINNINGQMTNLRNVEDKKTPLPSAINLSGNSTGNGKFFLNGKMNVLKRIPDMQIGAMLEQVNLPALNNYLEAFAAIDVESGTFDFYTEFTVKNGQLSGYAKPIARNISIINLNDDKNPLEVVWEFIAAALVEIFSNQSRDQFATKIAIEGNISDVDSSGWEALIGILRNAFIQAWERGLDSSGASQKSNGTS